LRFKTLRFHTHASWLDPVFTDCPIFLTAVLLRGLTLVSVSMWLFILSNQLWIIGLVSFTPPTT